MTTSRPSSITSTKKTRFSFSGIASGSKSSKRDSLFRRTPSKTDNSLGPLDTRSYLNNENFSEVSAGSSASQIRTMSKVIVKKFDKMSSSTLSVLSLGGSGINKEGYKNEDEGDDRMGARGRNLEIILDAGMDISAKLRAFFEKNKDILRDDLRAGNLRIQNERILEGDWGMLTEIAVFGDNGIGKSSLINALLDVEYITPTQSSGSSCEGAPIEFRARDRTQKMSSKYTIVSTLLTPAEWLPFAEQLLDDIQEDAADGRCNTARKILKSLFNLSEDAEVVLEDIQAIPISCGELAEKLSTQDISEVNKYIERLNSKCWAVLKKITIYMDSPVLNTGVVLVDLPGLGKISPMNIGTVNGYLKSCECILVVSDISRVGMDDLFLDPALEPIARRARLDPSSKFAFILTQIDNIPRVANDPKWNKKREILSRVAATRDMIHKSPKSRLNNSSVFFTSSLEYQWHHNRLSQPKMASCISPEESGIPALRRFIQEKGLQRREEVVKSLVQGNMTTFMNSVQHWCVDEEVVLSTPEEEVMTPEELQMCFEDMQKSIHDSIVTGVSNPLSALVKAFEGKIKDEDILRTTANEAQGIVNRWISAPRRHYQALVKAYRRKGSFTDTGTNENIDWNKSIADLLIDSVNEHWESAFNQADATISDMFENVSGIVIKTVSDAVNQTTDPEKIANELPPIAVGIYNIIHTQERLWQTNLTNTNNLITGNQNLLKDKLDPFYETILNIKGDGAVIRSQKYASEKLPELVLAHYGEVCNGVFEKLKLLLEGLEEKLISELDGVLEDVKLNYFHREPVEAKPKVYVDLKPVKGELVELCKLMKQLEFIAMRPRITVEAAS